MRRGGSKGIVLELSCAVVQKLEKGLWNHDLKHCLRFERIWHCLFLDPFYSTSREETSIGRCTLGCAGEWEVARGAAEVISSILGNISVCRKCRISWH